MATGSASSTSSSGYNVTAVTDTVTQTTTYTLTGPNGETATTTQPANGSLTTTSNALKSQLPDPNASTPGLGYTIGSAGTHSQNQANEAASQGVSSLPPTATPVSPPSDPAVAQDQTAANDAAGVTDDTTPPVDQSVIDPASDPDISNTPPPDIVTSPDSNTEVDPLSDPQIDIPEPPEIPDTGDDAPSADSQSQGLTGDQQTTAAAPSSQDQENASAVQDWRVRVALPPGANYLYKTSTPGILQPLVATDGVIFPYTPSINVTYAANYDAQSLVGSNYKVYQYTNSSVDSVTITGDFTCQDVFEANYLLAVIHFFRSMTKMFYGQDNNPKNGTPPPLCYLHGMGAFQFDTLPLAITNFTYALPADVDYIMTTGMTIAGVSQPSYFNNNTSPASFISGAARLLGLPVGPGGTPRAPVYPTTQNSANQTTTWVPTKMNISISCAPVLSRNSVSNQFSLQDYASGDLLRGSQIPGGGFW